MKILHLVKTSVGATWAYRLTRDLVKSGVEVHVAMPTNGPLVEQYKNAGIIVHELSYSIKNLFKTIKKLRRIVNKVQPDIIHSHFVLTTLIMRLALRSYNIPRVFQVPGPLHLEHYIYRKMDLMTAQRYVDFWIPTCKWSYETYKTCGISEDRLFITYFA